VLDEQGLWESPAPIAEPALARFGELVEFAARPINDVRGTAAYRHHAVRVLGKRTLKWAWDEYRGEAA
jgi:CO/xanthine dehydrogenase FAD-binding subunit